MSLAQFQNTLKRWGLREIPFRDTPPDDIEELARVFHGRSRELELALPTLFEGRNVLVRGPWGIGKTASIRTLLHRLQREVRDLDEEMSILYIERILGDTPNDFYRAVLLAVAESLAERGDDEARAIAASLTGRASFRPKWKREGKVTLGVFSYSAQLEAPNATAIEDPYLPLMPMLEKAEEKFSRVVIAVDDLDKKDAIDVQNIIEQSLGLIRQGKRRGFLLTGRGFSDLQEATFNALGVFSEILDLKPMSLPELRQIALNYLNLARATPSDDPFPFTEEVLNLIVAYSRGVPRQLNRICEKVLRQAAQEGRDRLDLDTFTPIWDALRAESFEQLSPNLRRLIYIARTAGGIDEDIDDRSLEQLDAITFTSLLPKLKDLEDRDILIREEGELGDRFYPSSLYLPPSTTDEDAK